MASILLHVSHGYNNRIFEFMKTIKQLTGALHNIHLVFKRHNLDTRVEYMLISTVINLRQID